MRNSTLLRRLEALYALFPTEDTWCTGSLGKDAYGVPVDGASKRAVCRCLLGGIDAVEMRGSQEHIIAALGFHDRSAVWWWNDFHGNFSLTKDRIAKAISKVRKQMPQNGPTAAA